MRRVILFLLAIVVLPGCWPDEDGTDSSARAGDIGDIPAGRTLIDANGCGTCHIIPGIDGAQGLVGPPLNHMARRSIIAEIMQNTPSNMVSWLLAPQQVVPGNAMPDLGLSEEEALDVTAYLYTLD